MLEGYKLLKAIKYFLNWSKFPRRTIKGGLLEFGRISLPNQIYSFARGKMGRSFKPNWLNYSFLKDFEINYEEKRDSFIREFKGKRVIEKRYRSITGRGLPGLLRMADRTSMFSSVECSCFSYHRYGRDGVKFARGVFTK